MNIDTSLLLNTNPDGSSLRSMPQQILGVNDFLKLLTVQLANQDPLNPVTDTAFISQMASFTSLAQMSSLTRTMEQFTEQQQKVAAQSYLGKRVTLDISDDAGLPVQGVVSAVSTQDQKVVLTIGQSNYPVRAVNRVELSD